VEKVDILLPPTFKKSGVVKTKQQALEDEDWIGTFNLWIIQSKPLPAVVYQQRGPNKNWAPNKLDVTAGGHYEAGEEIYDGLREVREELGKDYKVDQLTYLGKKLHVSPDTKGRMRHNAVDIFMTIDDSGMESYKLQESEVYAICVCPIDELMKVHTSDDYRFKAYGVTAEGEQIEILVNKDSFPYNWDNYHFKIVMLAERLLRGEKYLVY
jgi:hypothetical protein